jgi:hypothetical protein
LSSVRDEDWIWVPPGGFRTIRRIAVHVGGGVFQLDCHAFGSGAPDWRQPLPGLELPIFDLEAPTPLRNEPPMSVMIEWIAERHADFRMHLAALEDDRALDTVREHYDGVRRSIRWYVAMLITHYTYHAGEINHIRALRQQNDTG